jgi:hypothetical protein
MRIVNIITTFFVVVHTVFFFSDCAPRARQSKIASKTMPFVATKVGNRCGDYAPKVVELGGTTPWSGINELFEGDCDFEPSDDASTVNMTCNAAFNIKAKFVGHDDGGQSEKTVDISVVSPWGSCETKYVIRVQNERTHAMLGSNDGLER